MTAIFDLIERRKGNMVIDEKVSENRDKFCNTGAYHLTFALLP